MGEAKRKQQPETPTPEQPIPAEKLKALYPEMLELQLADAQLQLSTKFLRERNDAFMAKVKALAPHLDLREWSLDFKGGRMVRAVAPKEN